MRASVAAAGAALLVTLAWTVSGTAEEDWEDGEERGRWRLVFDGYGSVTGDDDHVVLSPRAAGSPDRTHGALVVTTDVPTDDAGFAVSLTTEEQLRQGAEPNPWEVGWVLWNYTDNDHFYAVALKPNGWEVSKQDPAYPGKQRFLDSGSEPTFPVGQEYRVQVTESGGSMVVRADGRVLAEITDQERPYTTGAVGLYTEDARVRFTNLVIDDPGAR